MADSLANDSLGELDRSPMTKERADRQPALLAIVSAVLTCAILSAALVTWVLWGIISGTWFWPWARASYPTPSANPDLLAVIRVGLTVVAGAGGVVALVVAYRKQALAERQEAMAIREEARAERDENAAQVLRFVERFGTAASQLGDQAPAVRLAGVYAMASLADQYADRRQQCIDVLCGYVRLPYSPDPGDVLLAQHLSEKITAAHGTTLREQRTYNAIPNDQHVRTTITSVIAAHLHTDAPVSWSSNKYDFTGGALHNTSFNNSAFSKDTTFTGVTFSGKTTFAGAKFSGNTTFAEAKISGDATFEDATFSGGTTTFEGATFSGTSCFKGAAFSGATTFDWATFSGYTWFVGATFSGDTTTFVVATFSGDTTTFEKATFSGDVIKFDKATLSGGTIMFDGAMFSGGRTEFNGLLWVRVRGVSMRDIRVLDGATITRDGRDFRGWPEPSA